MGSDLQATAISDDLGANESSHTAQIQAAQNQPGRIPASGGIVAEGVATGLGYARAAVEYPPRCLPRESLTPEQERVLLEHLPVVRFLARRIHERLPQHVEIDDLFSAGVVGLMDAFAKFDPTKKVQFRSYAQFRIRGAILDSLRTLDWSPRELRRKGRAVEEAIHVLTSRLGRAPGEVEIAAQMGLALEAYQQLLGELKGLEIGTLHLERNEDSGEEELAYVPGRPEEDPLFRCLRGEMEERLTGAIQDLPERERLVMTLYYYEEMTMREIGMALGVVESRVSQIHASAVLHLRSGLSDLAGRGIPANGPGKKPGKNPGKNPNGYSASSQDPRRLRRPVATQDRNAPADSPARGMRADH
jgi:RNA polymerase sigma factor for flagellar operon FliA